MPLLPLIAIFTAFWFHPDNPAPLARVERDQKLLEVLGPLALVLIVSAVLGRVVVLRAARGGPGLSAARRLYARGARVVDLLVLGAFGWIIHGEGWPRVVETGLGLRGWVLIDEALILLPYLLAQGLAWWALYPAESAVRPGPEVGLGRYLELKARKTLGLVLPVALVFALGQDVLRIGWPGADDSSWVQVAALVGMGTLILTLAPALVRLSWPNQPLPAGPLRERLERLARRYHFRCTDILVWDTGGTLVNAGVTGAWPWFRYVLLTDALIECLDERQIEAVFGHEIGHIAHRHLPYFGWFLMGSLGVIALAAQAIEHHLVLDLASWTIAGTPALDVVRAAVVLAVLGLYFLVVFGLLSRRFERQADVFGCRAVSCGQGDCPPHADLNGYPGALPSPAELCPVGIRIFTNALVNVASSNGTGLQALSWRHGSIRRRVAFLEGLEGRPEVERRFQADLVRLRLILGVLLALATLAAIATGALEQLR